MINKIKIEDKEIIIIGTAHVSKKNIEQVKNTILKEEPEIVGIEIDRGRLPNLLNKNKEQQKIKLKDIFKSRNPFLFLTMYALGNFQQKIAKNMDTIAGGEMLSAIKSAKEIDAKVLLLDRDINITFNRLWKNLSFFEKIKILFGGLFLNKKERESLKDINIKNLLNEVEKEEDNSKNIENIMKIFSKKFKKLKRILIDERDTYMAYNILSVDCKKIVVVVGAGHTKGIIKNLKNPNKLKKTNIRKLLRIKD
jgi:pheromone shutdown-related protein TraB